LLLDLFIITGTSQGLGRALAEHCLAQGHWVLSISRKSFPAHPRSLSIRQDLRSTKGLESKLKATLNKLKKQKLDAVHLINNAAVIEPIGSIEGFTAKGVEEHLRVNLLTPIELCRIVMKLTLKNQTRRSLIQISSGAAYRPIQGWSLYCASKAGLKMFNDSLGVDFAGVGVRLLNFSPGVMDTQMQGTIRQQPAEKFSRVEDFRQMKKEGKLLSPTAVAEKLYELILNPMKYPKTDYDICDLAAAQGGCS
jgi:benzil reductase ((S)-benzoin forming)